METPDRHYHAVGDAYEAAAQIERDDLEAMTVATEAWLSLAGPGERRRRP